MGYTYANHIGLSDDFPYTYYIGTYKDTTILFFFSGTSI